MKNSNNSFFLGKVLPLEILLGKLELISVTFCFFLFCLYMAKSSLDSLIICFIFNVSCT